MKKVYCKPVLETLITKDSLLAASQPEDENEIYIDVDWKDIEDEGFGE